TGGNAGAGSLLLNGAGTLDLGAANTFTGGVTIQKGTLELSNSSAAGTGAITFAAGAKAFLQLDAGVYAPNTVSGLATGAARRFRGEGAVSWAQPAAGGVIQMAASAAGETVVLQTGSTLGATVKGFGIGDAIEFEAVPFAATDTVSYANGLVSVLDA